MENLFNQKRVEDYFNQIDRSIKNEIDNYSEQHLATLDIDKVTELLFKRFSIEVPFLLKEETNSYITTELLDGHQLPSGTSFILGEKYPIDIANYKIPFSGTSELFYCIPTNRFTGLIEGSIKNGFIIIQLTNWGKLIDNEEALKGISDSIVQSVEKIDNILASLKLDVDKFSDSLKSTIKTYLTEKVSQIKLKIESSQKLNPFKKSST
jgi:hypothetical protein